ncbi:MAG TPA: DUF1080 domain-containing protein [Gemmataceae bacterium]|nr:DUF1080 domain-containing protein [Gemmataceae bacterium]
MKTAAWLAASIMFCGLACSLRQRGTVSADEKGPKDRFVPLFELPTWKLHQGTTTTWAFTDDGTIVAHERGWLMTKREYRDFELRLEIKLERDADAAIAIRSSADPDTDNEGLQIQFVDECPSGHSPRTDRRHWLRDIPPLRDDKVTRDVGEWTKVHIIAKDRGVKISINNVLAFDSNLVDREGIAERTGMAKHENMSLLREKGHIALQARNGRIEFRNVEIKELD